MTQKLFAFAKGKCCAESCDNPMFQEVLLAGHLYQNVLKVRGVHLVYDIFHVDFRRSQVTISLCNVTKCLNAWFHHQWSPCNLILLIKGKIKGTYT